MVKNVQVFVQQFEADCAEQQTKITDLNAALMKERDEVQRLREQLAATKADADARVAEAKQAVPFLGWKNIGTLHSFNFEEMSRKYPFTHYQWGATYNTTTIRPVTINNWNRGLRVHIDGHYLQGDNGSSLYMGSAMMTRGTDDAGTQATKKADGSAEFLHHYVSPTGKAKGSNANSFCMHVRKLAHPWTRVGSFVTTTDLNTCLKTYPPDAYEWGTDYNSPAIKPLTVTQWNRGYRIHVTTPYMQNDSVGSMRLGTSVWTRDTDDAESKAAGGKFYHRYYQCQDDHNYLPKGSNGTAGFSLFVRRF